MDSSNTDVDDDQEAWVLSISSEISSNSTVATFPITGRFFKVPAPQREATPGAYDPYVFSFGPYHAKFDQRPSVADLFKLQAAKSLLQEGDFEALVDQIQQWDRDLRYLYGGEEDRHVALIRPRTLAHLLALDAITIIAITLQPQVFQATSLKGVLWKDVILLENQIPLLLIQETMDRLTIPVDMNKFVSWHWHATSPFCDAVISRDLFSFDVLEMHQSLLGCIYDGLTGANSPSYGNTSMIPTATHLWRSGIRFSSCKGMFADIRFDEETHVLFLPRILVAYDTQRLLLNLLAYEATSRFPQCCAVTSYVTLMDCLIDNEEDVRVLVECGVIENHMGSYGELASMWNKLRVGVPTLFTANDSIVIKRVNRGSKRKWRRWMVGFNDTYWERKPWLLISIVAATALLILSFLQTIYTMKA